MPYGLHFLQWMSSLHDKDWHNMPLEDRVVVMRRLAALEKKLLADGTQYFSLTHKSTAVLSILASWFVKAIPGARLPGSASIWNTECE